VANAELRENRIDGSDLDSPSPREPGRPQLSKEARELIVRMATENRWSARKIQPELVKLGIRVSLATVSRSRTDSC
jgi:hypothetical protein